MQAHSDYQRGLEKGRADAKQGWARCWMPARQLAKEAVYSHFGLIPEQQGYAAALDEAFPGGLSEISCFLDQMEPPGQPLRAAEAKEVPLSRVVDTLTPVIREPVPVVSQPVPVVQEPSPVVQKPCPIVSQPGPV
ncbi:hypothetical protein [Hymenobacter sp. YC55]|uniref:hypothetical protein n=1 Tax=Hymenobacter sp. YC55 TaxID=3034019 RepID=UPI0023F6FF6F|nr:hypothetical protein [Hymenobacter sp. YC55]MDF7815324.1 hypothetical protein [Hymenobacter sp. YC55]